MTDFINSDEVRLNLPRAPPTEFYLEKEKEK